MSVYGEISYVADDGKPGRVLNIPNTNPSLTDRETILKRFVLAEGIEGISYHLWVGLTAEPEQIVGVAAVYRELYPRVAGLKLFLGQSTGNMGICDYETQLAVFRTLKELNYRGVIAVHAEKESLLHLERYVAGRFETHSLVRPPEAELESVRDVIAITQGPFMAFSAFETFWEISGFFPCL